MNQSNWISQPMSTTMVEKSNFSSLSMFVMSPKEHLYSGLSVPPNYKYLSSTFSGAKYSPWTSPMSSIFGPPSGTSLMNITLDSFSSTYTYF